MTKFVLIMYLCSTITGMCPFSSIPGYTFDNHYDCVVTGYRVAHNTFKGLEQTEEIDRKHVEREKLVIKFECKPVNLPKPPKLIIPLPKPKVST